MKKITGLIVITLILLIAPISHAAKQPISQAPLTIAQCDTNGDNQVSILDVVATINKVLQGGEVITGTDCNDDGEVNILDVVAVINLVLSGSASIEAPQNVNAISKEGAIEITWDTVNSAESYNLYHSLEANFPDGSTDKILNVQSPYSLTGLTNGFTYYLALTAVDAGGKESNFSNEKSVVLENNTLTGKLNDTGITWGADYPEGNNSTCTGDTISAQDCSHGRDVTHNDNSDGHAGFSFTKLDSTGNPVPSSATNWLCVKDNVTGLIWEVKTDDGGLRDKDWRYTWYNSTGIHDGGSAGISCFDSSNCDTEKFVQQVNSQGLCGKSDWRMPTIKELENIVNFNSSNPPIDTDYFPNTNSSASLAFWSASPYARHSTAAWSIYSYYGNSDGSDKYRSNYVRLVRKGQ